MSISVLSVAYPFAPVGAQAVGGAEQVLGMLESALVARGHLSSVVARADSCVAGELFGTGVPSGLITSDVRTRVVSAHQKQIDRALRTQRIHVVHMHGIDFHLYRLPAHLPVLVTLHMPPSWYPEEVWSLPGNYLLQCVSQAQKRDCPAAVQKRILVIENGVAPANANRLWAKRNYALLLSRICPEKNLHAGLDAARLANLPALLAGETFPYEEHLQYFREHVAPRLGRRARFVGPAGGVRKRHLLAAARCLLLPTVAPETSSLTAMEAMAAGTPVVAYRSGALPEVIEHGRTGFLVNSVQEMADALADIHLLRADDCRTAASRDFSLHRMVLRYEAIYRALHQAAA